MVRKNRGKRGNNTAKPRAANGKANAQEMPTLSSSSVIGWGSSSAGSYWSDGGQPVRFPDIFEFQCRRISQDAAQRKWRAIALTWLQLSLMHR
jgi:hypothetical protein